MPQSQEEFWLVTRFSIDHINLQTGEILSRFPVQSTFHCVRETQDKKYMVYSLDTLNKKLYGFNLKNGQFEDDLRLPEIEKKLKEVVIEKMSCLEEGIEIQFSNNKFIFFKDYQDVKTSIGTESVHDFDGEITKKEMYKIKKKEDDPTSKQIFILIFRTRFDCETFRNSKHSQFGDLGRNLHSSERKTKFGDMSFQTKPSSPYFAAILISIGKRNQSNGVQNNLSWKH